MKPRTCDPFVHVPADSQVSVFAWQGRRERCEGRLSRSFGLDHAAARVYAAQQLASGETSKVQVVAKWVTDAGVMERRVDCKPSGHMTIWERNASVPSLPSRFPDANLDADVFALMDAA